MTRARSEWLPGWRAGLLVLGLYAMLMQAFLAAVAPPMHALAGPDALSLCVSGGESSGEGGQPAHPHSGKDCVCSALCHAGGWTVAGAPWGVIAIERLPVFVELAALAQPAVAYTIRATPPARAPPRVAFVLFT